MRLPAFIISFNRGQMLKRTIAGLRKMNGDIEIIVHDNGSDDPETLEILYGLQFESVSVFKRSKILETDDLNNTNETVYNYFINRQSTPYIVTDCDVDITCADQRAILVYNELLERFPTAECVGPMLRIHDIPRGYPLYARVMNRHIEQFWGKPPSWCDTSAGRTAYQFAPIDTTLAVHRAGDSFRRLKQGIRVYEPFEALHLDWYLTSHTADVYNLTSNPAISHWNNASEFLAHRSTPHDFSRYFIVERNNMGNLIEREIEFRRSGLP
jgi:glycosyltransferase involved in cell wall biosynthesis